MKPALNGLPDAIHADGRKLRQILYNLLSNAVKFTPDGGQVTISAAMLARNAARWTDTEGRALSYPVRTLSLRRPGSIPASDGGRYGDRDLRRESGKDFSIPLNRRTIPGHGRTRAPDWGCL